MSAGQQSLPWQRKEQLVKGKIITNFWEFRKMLMTLNSKRHSKSLQLSITLTKTQMIRRELKRSSKRLPMLMRLCLILKNEEFMTNLVKKGSTSMNRDRDREAVANLILMMFSQTSLVAEVVQEVEASDSTWVEEVVDSMDITNTRCRSLLLPHFSMTQK